jgi:hypothetical protein
MPRHDRIASPRLNKLWRGAMDCNLTKGIPLAQEQVGALRFADSDGAGEHGLEYWSQLVGRARNDPQNFGRCALVLSRLRQFAGKSADLLLRVGKG